MTQAETVKLDLPASARYLHLLGGCIKGLLEHVGGLADAQAVAYNIELAAHEIAANIVEHAYAGESGGRIEITLTLECGGGLVIELRDRGRSFELAAVPDPVLGELLEGGYGLFLARQLMDTVEYTSYPDGNYWRLVKRLEAGGSTCESR